MSHPGQREYPGCGFASALAEIFCSASSGVSRFKSSLFQSVQQRCSGSSPDEGHARDARKVQAGFPHTTVGHPQDQSEHLKDAPASRTHGNTDLFPEQSKPPSPVLGHHLRALAAQDCAAVWAVIALTDVCRDPDSGRGTTSNTIVNVTIATPIAPCANCGLTCWAFPSVFDLLAHFDLQRILGSKAVNRYFDGPRPMEAKAF